MSERVRPISPDHIAEYKEEHFPSEVFAAFNELIAKNFVNGSSTVKQKDVIALICNKMPDIGNLQIFAGGWLNIEDVYRDNGWKVTYDKPAYCESYDAFFVFKRK